MSAGYSGTPLAVKLGIKRGFRLGLLDAPAGFEEVLAGLPEDVKAVRGPRGRGEFDVMVLFVTGRAELEKKYPGAAGRLAMTTGSGLWIAWPKKSSGVATDITENLIREVCLPSGLVDNKVCAIDETWSGLRMVHRRK